MLPVHLSEVTPVAVEGMVDEAVLSRILRDFGVRPFPVYGKKGCAHLDSRLAGFNSAATHSPWMYCAISTTEAVAQSPLPGN